MIRTTLTPKESRWQVIFDVILISGDFWADHPHSGIGVIARVLEAHGYSVGIIEKPDWKSAEDFMRLGMPRLFFGISSGSIDSMLQNYTPLKKSRAEDKYRPFQSGIPDRAVIVYSQRVREAQKAFIAHGSEETNPNRLAPIILGGVEASLRRFTHYDYWDNKIRRPILFDAKADLLVYGPGEHQIVEVARRLDHGEDLAGIEGTCLILSKGAEIDPQWKAHQIPSFADVVKDKVQFCKMQLAFSNQKTLYQEVNGRFLIQFAMYPYTQVDLDGVYRLPFSYDIPDQFSEFQMAGFSIITHRGCIGNCNFCSISLHQGNKIISRSEESVLAEIKKMAGLPSFKKYIGDLGGPSANMYGMDCDQRVHCARDCMTCKNLDRSHLKLIHLLQSARSIPEVKKIFIRSGIRYDLALSSMEYIEEVSRHHISGVLKIAPEHFSAKICRLMNKPGDRFEEFRALFTKINAPLNQSLKYYLMTAHPGSTMEDVEELRFKMQELGEKNTESVQIFTPTPMSISTCMYYTGLDPFTLQEIYVPYSYQEKKRQKNRLYSKP